MALTSLSNKCKNWAAFQNRLTGSGLAGTRALALDRRVIVPDESKPITLRRAIGHVSYNPDKCAGCLTCMAVCSLYHEGNICLELARIQVFAPVLSIFEARGYTCKQCHSPECLRVCPVEALKIDEVTGARIIDEKKCSGCKLCIRACPQYPNSPIRYDASRNICVKCDLCGGEPQCVKFCPKSVDLSAHLYPPKDRVLKFVKTGSEIEVERI
jgi:Fe-S-cluster-containing hydrogenase component 2